MPTKFIDITDIHGETTTVNVNIIGRMKPETVRAGFSPEKAFIFFNDGSGKLVVDMTVYESVHNALIETKPVKKTTTRKTTTTTKE